MTIAYPAPPAPMRTEQLSHWLRRDGARDVTVLFDPAVADQTIGRSVLKQVELAGIAPRRTTLTTDTDLDGVLALAESLDEETLVIGVGGGSVLDQAKLATLFRASPEARARVSAPQRSGAVALPAHLGSSVRVVAVPTTLGTGTELGTVACVTSSGGKRLVTGPCLRPVASLLDPVSTSTLPGHLVSAGVLEALFRTVSPYVGDPSDLPTPDALTEALTVRLVEVGERTRALRSRGEPVDDATRLRIAELSGESQVGDTNLGRDPYAVKGWLLGNELSTVLGLSKMRAIAAVWPTVWAGISAGDSRLGDARRLDRIWQRVRTAAPYLSADPATGVCELIDAWLVDRHVTASPDQIDVIVTRVMRSWGAGLPMLGGLHHDEVRALLTRAVHVTEPPEGQQVPHKTSASSA